MMYSEFLALAKITPADLSAEQYAETVETVYMHHPAVNNVTGKVQVVAWYRDGLIPELLLKAREVQILEDTLYRLEQEAAQLEREYSAARQAAAGRYSKVQACLEDARRGYHGAQR